MSGFLGSCPGLASKSDSIGGLQPILKVLLHCASFHATCFATPFLQTFSHYERSRFTGVTLSNASCNLSRFNDHMNLKEHFHWLVPQRVATRVAGQMLHCAMLKRFVATVAESRTQFYFLQRFLQLVLQRFWPLQGMLHRASGHRASGIGQGMLHWAMIRATCLAKALRDKLHEKLRDVTAPLETHNNAAMCSYWWTKKGDNERSLFSSTNMAAMTSRENHL